MDLGQKVGEHPALVYPIPDLGIKSSWWVGTFPAGVCYSATHSFPISSKVDPMISGSLLCTFQCLKKNWMGLVVSHRFGQQCCAPGYNLLPPPHLLRDKVHTPKISPLPLICLSLLLPSFLFHVLISAWSLTHTSIPTQGFVLLPASVLRQQPSPGGCLSAHVRTPMPALSLDFIIYSLLCSTHPWTPTALPCNLGSRVPLAL